MTKKELKANIAYLESNGVSVSEDSVWSNFPDSRELYYATDVGRTWGTYYANGTYDHTDWCIFAGTYEECVNYVNDKNKQL